MRGFRQPLEWGSRACRILDHLSRAPATVACLRSLTSEPNLSPRANRAVFAEALDTLLRDGRCAIAGEEARITTAGERALFTARLTHGRDGQEAA